MNEPTASVSRGNLLHGETPLWSGGSRQTAVDRVGGGHLAAVGLLARCPYHLTSRRVIFESAPPWKERRSLLLDDLGVSVSEKRDGSGTLTFGSSAPAAGGFWSGLQSGALFSSNPRFVNIQDVHKVYRQLREAQQNLAEAPTPEVAATPPSPEVFETLRRELEAGEDLIWAAKPDSSLRFWKHDAFPSFMGLFIMAFLAIWMITAWSSGHRLFALFGLPHVAAGAYLAFGRLWLDARRRRRTTYGLTSKRLLVVTEGRRRETKSIPLSSLREVSVLEKPDGSGRLTFGPPQSEHLLWTGAFNPSLSVNTHLEGFSRVWEVYERLRAVQGRGGY